MRNVAFSGNSMGERWSRRSILRFFIPLGTIAVGVQLRALNSGSEAADSDISTNDDATTAVESGCFDFQATAYCESGTTKSGVPTYPGVVAADPSVLPLGSVIHVDVPRYRGIYQVMDTGRLIKGKIIDIFIPDYDLATEFGRRDVKVTVLRYGFSGPYLTSSD